MHFLPLEEVEICVSQLEQIAFLYIGLARKNDQHGFPSTSENLLSRKLFFQLFFVKSDNHILDEESVRTQILRIIQF